MNKKFSTLVASLLLMGAFGTVDAKLTKVNPQIGKSYLMGNAVNATPGTMNFAASVSVTNAKPIVKFGEAEWTLEQVLDTDEKPVKGQFYLKDVTGKYLNSKNNNGLAALSTKAKALTFVLKGGKVYVETDPNAKWEKGWLLGIANNTSGKPEVMAYADTKTELFVQFAVYSVADNIEGHALMNAVGSDYYYVGQTNAAGENAQVMGQNGKMITWSDDFATPEEVDKYLWKVEKKELSGRIFYVFTNKADDKKTYTYEAEAAYDKGFNLKEFSTVATALYQSPVIQKTGEELNKVQDGAFALTIKKGEKDDSEILGLDALSGDLKAVQNGVRFQLKSGDKYVVLNKKDTWGDNIGAQQRGAKFTTVTEKELTKNAANYGSYFEFYYNAGAADASKINAVKVFDKATGVAFGQLFIQTLNENVCLTTSTSIDPAAEVWPYIVLGSSKVVKPEDLVKPKFYTVTKIAKDGNTVLAATDCHVGEWNNYDRAFVKANEISNDLETQ